MSSFRELYDGDLARYPGGNVPKWNRRFHFFLRKTQTTRNRVLKTFYHFLFRLTSDKHCMEISYGASIGKGLFLPDPFLITVNSNAVIGKDVTLGKNVTIGKQNRGERAGSPVIGDRVTIGENAVIVGSIHVGNNVTIAPNTYINRDVPDGAAASGNPYTEIS